MVRHDGAEARKERYTKIAQTIQALLYQNRELGYVSLKKTVITFKVEMGLTYEKIMEYMQDLSEIGQFEIDTEKDQIRKPRV
jgi:hypothetical protein